MVHSNEHVEQVHADVFQQVHADERRADHRRQVPEARIKDEAAKVALAKRRGQRLAHAGLPRPWRSGGSSTRVNNKMSVTPSTTPSMMMPANAARTSTPLERRTARWPTAPAAAVHCCERVPHAPETVQSLVRQVVAHPRQPQRRAEVQQAVVQRRQQNQRPDPDRVVDLRPQPGPERRWQEDAFAARSTRTSTAACGGRSAARPPPRASACRPGPAGCAQDADVQARGPHRAGELHRGGRGGKLREGHAAAAGHDNRPLRGFQGPMSGRTSGRTDD